ncbi:MAG: sigma-54-dependent Fis family transcriptional regulator, partial [Deltaproteobacteria bacterium]|nr:sigma-54-dependent Fis family transcriptional regulator [Deltaproteobacteria bacterium]
MGIRIFLTMLPPFLVCISHLPGDCNRKTLRMDALPPQPYSRLTCMVACAREGANTVSGKDEAPVGGDPAGADSVSSKNDTRSDGMTETRILVVDDEHLIRWTLQKNLEKAGYGVLLAETGEDALKKIGEEAPDVVLLDINLPGMNGFEVLEKALEMDQTLIPIMITAYDDLDRVVKAIKLGAFDYMVKPLDFKKVNLSIDKALETHRLKKEVRHLRQERRGKAGFSNIIAVSPVMRQIMEMTEKVAMTEAATVLIQGESGTGKEMIAQAVHDLSRRSNMPFVALTCPGVAEHLMENEL